MEVAIPTQMKLRDLLASHGETQDAKERLSELVASRAMQMNHLYVDMGFESRVVMGKFMATHFPLLASQKPKETLWKKYLFDLIGEVAPACALCDDRVNCFRCTQEDHLHTKEQDHVTV